MRPPGVKSAELVAVLQSNAPKTEKVKAFKPLAVFGNKDAVPAIAPYLSDEQLSSWARIALEAIPDPACDEALRKAEIGLKGRLLIGVINSIGVRRDAKAVDALVKRLGDADPDVAVAAAAALARINGDAAAQALEKALATVPPAVRSEVADAVVRCAEKYLADGKKNEAIRLYDLVSKADVPQNRVLEAVRGAILARGSAGLPLLVDLLKSADKRQFALGLKLTREISASEVTDALLAELAQASPAQSLLLLALADRADHKSRDALLQAAKTAAGEVRIASIRGLKKAGDASCGPVLLDAALDVDADVSAAAVDVLADLPAKEIDELLAARLQSVSGDKRLVLIDLVGRRHVETVTTVLLKLAGDPDARIRSAALTALGATIPVKDLAVLIARAIAQDKPEEAKAAEAALHAACAHLGSRCRRDPGPGCDRAGTDAGEVHTPENARHGWRGEGPQGSCLRLERFQRRDPSRRLPGFRCVDQRRCRAGASPPGQERRPGTQDRRPAGLHPRGPAIRHSQRPAVGHVP